MGHFFLLGSDANPDNAEKHDAAGGIFAYKRVDETGAITQDIMSMSLANITLFLQNISDKRQTRPSQVHLATINNSSITVAPSSISNTSSKSLINAVSNK